MQERLSVENHPSTSHPPYSDDSKKPIEKPAPVDRIPQKPVEIGGPKGPDPTRFGDWEKAGRCSDF
ncbi:MAG: succinate dehydrogenase assembly factor 4 [Lysobacterales bacterium]